MTKTWCRVCGVEYDVCHTCAETKRHTPYRIVCDTAKHYQIWLIVEQYRKGLVDAVAAAEQIAGIRVTKKERETFIPAVRDILKEIEAKAK